MVSDGPIAFRYSPMRLIGLLLLGIVMTALSGVVAVELADPGSITELVGYAGTAFFGAGTLVVAQRLVRDRDKAIVRITETGFTDIRLAPEEIPWRSIEGIGTWVIKLQKILTLDVDPEVEKTLSLTRTVRWSRAANAALGVRGLTTTTQGLDVDFETLLDLCKAHVQRAHRPD